MLALVGRSKTGTFSVATGKNGSRRHVAAGTEGGQEYGDGSEERVPIVKLPRKPPRVTLDKSKRKGL